MDRSTKIFNVGDYIGDKNDKSWRVEEVKENSYVLKRLFNDDIKEVSKEKNPNKLKYVNCYIEDFYLLRTRNHEDVKNFPIGSKWICTEKTGLNDPKKDTVIISDYAYSEGYFWICNSNSKSLLFLADTETLKPCKKTKIMDADVEKDDNFEMDL